MELYIFAVVILICLAVFDLTVGVSNDAVNFLNSSIGSKAAPRSTIMIIASLGILAGVTFSSGMMEVARKGIFHPEFFTMPEIMVIFLAVMLTDILLLDLYNTFGLPTSTTVSIVFELLGAAVAVSLIKIGKSGEGYATLAQYINTSKALAIIAGILLSIVIAFVAGALAQFVTRLIFTFDYHARLNRYGAAWGGIALTMIAYFIIIKGSKGASFITPDMHKWILEHVREILIGVFIFSAVIFEILLVFFKVNILKPIVLTGTFALAMAFAANDLVNFIGVPLAGLSALRNAAAGASPLTVTMDALKQPVQTNTFFLLLAGLIMVITLWFSRKARSVTETEVSLGRQDEGMERFSSSALSRVIVRMVSTFFRGVRMVIPDSIRWKISARIDPSGYNPKSAMKGKPPSFDLLRASVNLMVASAVVSFATSLKLPLSTTYVTFMVAMGSSLSDQAWGRESAVYRVTGVLTVIAGWFFTAFMAFTASLSFAFAVFYFRAPAVLFILGLGIFSIWRNHHIHRERTEISKGIEVFNIEKVDDAEYAIRTSFEQSGYFLKHVNESLNACFNGLFIQDRIELKRVRRETKKLQNWANIIVANTFKTLRWLYKTDVSSTKKYAQIINSLQEIAESHRDAVMRSYMHISNNHKGLLPVQIEELNAVRALLSGLLEDTSRALMNTHAADYESAVDKNMKLGHLAEKLDRRQILRIQDESSKTRLSILFYGLLNNSLKISEHTLNLLEIYRESFSLKVE